MVISSIESIHKKIIHDNWFDKIQSCLSVTIIISSVCGPFFLLSHIPPIPYEHNNRPILAYSHLNLMSLTQPIYLCSPI